MLSNTATATQLPPLPEPRKPLTREQIDKGRRSIRGYDEDDHPNAWSFGEGVRFAEKHHDIKENP